MPAVPQVTQRASLLGIGEMEKTSRKGSRYSDGNVPNVNRNNDDDVYVNRYGVRNQNPNLRARREVSHIIRSYCADFVL